MDVIEPVGVTSYHENNMICDLTPFILETCLTTIIYSKWFCSYGKYTVMISKEQIDSVVAFDQQHPYGILGPHRREDSTELVAYLPLAVEAAVLSNGQRIIMTNVRNRIYRAIVPGELEANDYRIEFKDHSGYVHKRHDPYAFAPSISNDDLYLFKKGDLLYSYRTMGSHRTEKDGVTGVVFRVWAPNARAVSIVSNFNHWKAGSHPMNNVQNSGIWELFVPDIGQNELYKFAIKTQKETVMKIDPYAFRAQQRPETASIVDNDDYVWGDDEWIRKRDPGVLTQPLAIYEVHLGSWKRGRNGFMNYRELADQLSKHCRDLGFNYVELMPVMEHPLDDSWGYQITNYYAASSRYGSPSDLKYFIDVMHQNGIGVILDWAPAHFPADEAGLSKYDGTNLYEHDDPRRGKHPDWGTLIFNYSRNEVRNFLISNAVFWVNEYHVDGLRVDAVSSMLYLDYSRKAGQWVPNRYGGNENLEAIDMIRELTGLIHEKFPGVMIIAEESTAWAGVTGDPETGGLGFDFKWNMGWMHDTLLYFTRDPVYRKYHQGELSFSMIYAYNERFILPLSHDEVVHGKGSLLAKMPGDNWQKFANLRLCLSFMYTFPGKKLLFMGSELGSLHEWNFSDQLDWTLVKKDENAGITTLVRDLNSLYRSEPCLYEGDTDHYGFEWIDFSDAENSIISYLRYSSDMKQSVVCVLNFTPTPRSNYSIGVPASGRYREVINSDSKHYGGSDVGNMGAVTAKKKGMHGRSFSLNLTLPPLGALILMREKADAD